VRICTWVDCEEPAIKEQVAEDGNIWADLCVDHNKELSEATASENVVALMRAWVRAQGGAKEAALKGVV